MKAYIVHKLVHAIGVAFVISFVSFFLLYYSSDPVTMLLPENADDEDIRVFKESMGLDQPIMIQYVQWLGKIVQGDFGDSWISKVPAGDLIGVALWPTVQLALIAQVIATGLAIPLGVLCAVRRYSLIDNITTFFVLVGQAMPLFWLGIMLIIIFAVHLRWLPASGSDTWMHLILPSITLASFTLPLNMRLVRSGMLEVLTQDYIRTARAKGANSMRVLGKHAFRNAAIPLVTVTGLQFGALLGGAVVTETVFAWPGLGRLAVESIQVGDFPVVQGVVLILAGFTIIANLAADIGSALIDPRIRFD